MILLLLVVVAIVVVGFDSKLPLLLLNKWPFVVATEVGVVAIDVGVDAADMLSCCCS